jgi:hypothetical protein
MSVGAAAEFGGQLGEGQGSADDCLRGGNAQRQRQPRAQPGQLGDRRGFGAGPDGADAQAEQFQRLGVGEDVKGEQARAMGRGQPGELIPARDQHQAPGCGGQQRP